MSKTDMAPAPINLFTSWISYFAKLCKKGTGVTFSLSAVDITLPSTEVQS